MKKSVIIILVFLSLGQVAGANNWLKDFEEAQKLALATNRLILVDFWASWCGPCKKMDLESWSKDEVKTLMKSYVPVQIDIDINSQLANKYKVKGIPYIFILDGNGKVVYQSMSYKGKSEVMKLLEKYALSTQFLNKELVSYFNKQNFVSAYRLGTKYHDYTLYLDKHLRRDFLKTADVYFDEALDYLDKEGLKNKAAFKQKIDLFDVQKEIFVNNPKRALRLLKKIEETEVDKMNKSFYAFLNYAVYTLSEDPEQAKIWEAQVKAVDKEKVQLLKKNA